VSKVLQVRNVPDDVHAELRLRAAASGESLSDYVLHELQRVAARSTNADLLARSAQRTSGPSRTEIAKVIRDIRGRA
jgi:plasmid stability protein